MGVGYAPAAPVAKLDKAPVYETGDCWFESSRVRQVFASAPLPAAKAQKGSWRRELQGDLLAEGVALMLVGMGSVFAFLLILVFATMALGAVTQRFTVRWQAVADVGEGPSLEEAAAIAAALHRHRR